MISKGLAANTIKCTNVIRNAIIFDNKMPSLYIDKNFHVDEKLCNSVYSIEHVFPRSYISIKHTNDMHNIVKTINTLNVNRSNYEYTDIIDANDCNWIKLDFDNYVNHKRKLFIPNSASRGFISRAILYMCKEYDYNPLKIIKKDVLTRWFFEFPPTKEEKYHNEMSKKMQNKNNIFVANYRKKMETVVKYIEKL